MAALLINMQRERHAGFAQPGNGFKTEAAVRGGSGCGFGVGGGIRSTLNEGSYGT